VENGHEKDNGRRQEAVALLRELLLQGKVVAARTQEDRQQIRMLEGGCNNLNQLAKMAHQQGFPRTKERITALLEEFNRIITQI